MTRKQEIEPEITTDHQNVSDREPSDISDVRENLWIRFMTVLHWYPQDMPSIEKKLVLKLDLMILIFGCLMFFTKYLDQASLTNAYVT
jgi:ACS family pantothenate transporter-like MFS transporter